MKIPLVGTFDGVHFGHQKIIQRLQKIAKKNNGESNKQERQQ